MVVTLSMAWGEPGREAAVHGVRALRLDAIDAAVRLHGLDGAGDAGAEPAARRWERPPHPAPAPAARAPGPQVAVPSAMVRPSKGWMKVRPSSASMARTASKAAWTSGTSTRAPRRSGAPGRRGRGPPLPSSPPWPRCRRGARRRPRRWRGCRRSRRVTPRFRPASSRASALSSAPRALKVPVRWNSSSLRKTALSGPSASETAAAAPAVHRGLLDQIAEGRPRSLDRREVRRGLALLRHRATAPESVARASRRRPAPPRGDRRWSRARP